MGQVLKLYRQVGLDPVSDLDTQSLMIAEAVCSIGQQDFIKIVAELCEGASGYDSTFICAFFKDHRPVELFDNLKAYDFDATVEPYIDCAYLLDPFYNIFRTGTVDQVVTLNECAPDDFRSTEYYNTFYAQTGLYDETTLLVDFGENACIAISLGSRHAGFELSAEGYQALQRLLPIIAALCRRHWPALQPTSMIETGRIRQHLEKAFELFCTSVLSAREAEIVQHILKGHSSKSIAQLLGNSPETIKVHRKRLFVKLNISSQGELFSMFLEALSNTPPNATEDPIVYLDRDISPREIY